MTSHPFVQQYEALQSALSHAEQQFDVKSPGEAIWYLTPRRSASDKLLTFFAAIHGNEIGGIDTLRYLVDQLTLNPSLAPCRIAVAVGNLEGARRNVRFVDADLNRRFGSSDRTSLEGRRAADLQAVLDDTTWLLDLHQTIEYSEQPFFIFPHTACGMAMARRALPEVAIVTRHGEAFSKEGSCTDEYLNGRGGSGITLELGGKGRNVYHAALGLRACLNLLDFVRDAGRELANEPFLAPVYTWAHVEPRVESTALRPGLTNFQYLAAGTEIGNSPTGAIVTPVAGHILFPNYRNSGAELYRLLRPANAEDSF